MCKFSTFLAKKRRCGCELQKIATFAPHQSGCGVIGSHARLRIWCREAWGFESLHPHFNRADFSARFSFDEGTRSACCASADLSSQGGIAVAITCLCQTIVFENRFSEIVCQTQTISDCTAFCSVCSRLLPPFESCNESLAVKK